MRRNSQDSYRSSKLGTCAESFAPRTNVCSVSIVSPLMLYPMAEISTMSALCIHSFIPASLDWPKAQIRDALAIGIESQQIRHWFSAMVSMPFPHCCSIDLALGSRQNNFLRRLEGICLLYDASPDMGHSILNISWSHEKYE